MKHTAAAKTLRALSSSLHRLDGVSLYAFACINSIHGVDITHRMSLVEP